MKNITDLIKEGFYQNTGISLTPILKDFLENQIIVTKKDGDYIVYRGNFYSVKDLTTKCMEIEQDMEKDPRYARKSMPFKIRSRKITSIVFSESGNKDLKINDQYIIINFDMTDSNGDVLHWNQSSMCSAGVPHIFDKYKYKDQKRMDLELKKFVES